MSMNSAKKLEDLNILVVEDDADFAETLEDMLHYSGIHTSTAKDGAEAQNITHQKKFDLVISDINMPNCNGMELLSIIQGSDKTPTILMSGYANKDLEQQAKSLGAKGLIAKPFHREDLMRMIENIASKISEQEKKETAKSIYLKEIDPQIYQEASDFLIIALKAIRRDPVHYSRIENLKKNSYNLFAHSIASSLYSILIARAMGWTSKNNLLDLARNTMLKNISDGKILSPLELKRNERLDNLGTSEIQDLASAFCALVFPEDESKSMSPSHALDQIKISKTSIDPRVIFALSILI